MTQKDLAFEAGAATDRSLSRVGAAGAFLGLVVYFTSAVLHPDTPPHDTRAAFAHYADEPYWGIIHLAELLGALLMSASGLALSWRLRKGAACAWAALGGAAMIVFSAVYAVFAAVDGVGIGILVRRLAAAGPDNAVVFEAAYAVRQVEAGLFALQWFMFGLAAAMYTFAFISARSAGPWFSAMAVLSALASVGTLAFAVAQAQTGFTETSMAFQLGLYPGVLWVVAVGIFLLRSPVSEAQVWY
ncbi:hypothetical protein WG922_09300 [Ramlibacter sp. AN1015]|uniref:hypothetical protein n=1 Tax=Ramlibacter sp. AN1015 TaxID=3133428 RepID=UPI0030BBC50E